MSVQQMSSRVARRFRRLLFLCGLSAVCLPAVANAAVMQTTLDQLLPGGNSSSGIVIGDKRYSNFTFSSGGQAPVRAQDVNVRISNDATATNPNGQQYTIQFTFGLDAFPGERNDLVICYQLDVLSNDFINRVGLRFNGSVPSQGVGDAAASVIETVSSVDPDGAGPRTAPDVAPGLPDRDTEVLDVFNDGPGRLEDDNSDFMTVNQTRSLLFCKDILVSSRPDGGYAAISIVDNVVDQIPEPGAIGLVSLVGGSMLLRRRRQA
jgi:hypothetical protein